MGKTRSDRVNAGIAQAETLVAVRRRLESWAIVHETRLTVPRGVITVELAEYVVGL
jgi:hypothetical protein